MPTVHKETDIVRFANEIEEKEIIDGFNKRSAELKETGAIQLYDDLVEKYGLDFLYRLFNKGKLYVRLDTSRFLKNRMLKKYIKKHKKYILYLYNYFNCETHIEYIKTILDKQIHQGDKK